MGAVLGCQPVSSRLISIRLRAAPFNITIIQVYAPTSGHDDSEVDHFYQKLQETIDQTPKKDILVVQEDWNAKVGKDAQADWGEVCGPYCNVKTNERGLRLLEFATFNNLVLTNTLGPHKPSRRWTCLLLVVLLLARCIVVSVLSICLICNFSIVATCPSIQLPALLFVCVLFLLFVDVYLENQGRTKGEGWSTTN